MYSTKTATVAFESNYMPVGINENITLKEVNVNKSPQGKDFLEFVFENESGQTATMTEWKNEKNTWIVTDDDLQSADNRQFGRILQILDAVKGGHNDFEGSSFAEMINWTKAQFADGDSDKVRLKVSFDKKGYTQVSKNGIFIESMSIPKEDSQIKLWKNDLLERPVKADIEKPNDPLAGNSTPVTESASTGTGADDLPF